MNSDKKYLQNETIKQYIEHLFNYCEGWIALRSFPESGKKGKSELQWVYANSEIALQKIYQFVELSNKNKQACYLIPGTVSEVGKAGSGDIVHFGNILIDIDHGDVQAKLQHLSNFIGKPSMIVASGGITPEGFSKLHCYWKLTEAAENEDIKLVSVLREKMAVKVGGDTHFKSAHQPIRIAGSGYYKNDSNKTVKIIDINNLEYDLSDLEENIAAMPPMKGVTPLKEVNFFDFNDEQPKNEIKDILTHSVNEGGKDEWTRFEGASRAIGYFIRRFHDGMITWEAMLAEIKSFNEACLRPAWTEERLLKETKALYQKHVNKYGEPKEQQRQLVKVSFVSEMLQQPDIPPDIISPRVLIPAGTMLFAGAPKVGKSDFLLAMFLHMAAGEEFLGFKPHKPLKVFYLQMEIQQHFIHERIYNNSVNIELKKLAGNNFAITPKLNIVLDEKGLEYVIELIKETFKKSLPDIICIDPIRNLFDADGKGSENDNQAMMFFLQERIERLRAAINSRCGIVLVHHIKKVNHKDLESDPFQAISGAAALRGYYDTGMILYQSNDDNLLKELAIELRNGEAIDKKLLRKVEGQWQQENVINKNLVTPQLAEKHKNERGRKRDIICDIIREEALNGHLLTTRGLCDKYEDKHHLGSSASIRRRVDILISKGYIKFCKDKTLTSRGSRNGFLCVEGMQFLTDNGDYIEVLPTHYKHPSTGALIDVEDSRQWIYQD